MNFYDADITQEEAGKLSMLSVSIKEIRNLSVTD